MRSFERFSAESLEVRVNDPPVPSAAVAERSDGVSVELSDRARALATALEAAEAPSAQNPESIDIEPRMLMLAQIVARFFGRDVVIFFMQQPDSSDVEQPLMADAATSSFSFSRTELRAESETMQFQARGLVKTADGREVEIDLQLNLSRSFVEHVQLDGAGMERRLEDPLVINLDAASASLEGQRWRFDLDANGSKESLPVLGVGSGYLVMDRNGNGRIDDGRELFGALSGNGFADLSAYDLDGNGWIDRADPVFEQLQVWIGAGTGDERLKSLQDLGIGAIYLGSASTPFSINDPANDQLGQLRSTGVFVYESGEVGTVQQIDLAV